jgi:hypothetical protein
VVKSIRGPFGATVSVVDRRNSLVVRLEKGDHCNDSIDPIVLGIFESSLYRLGKLGLIFPISRHIFPSFSSSARFISVISSVNVSWKTKLTFAYFYITPAFLFGISLFSSSASSFSNFLRLLSWFVIVLPIPARIFSLPRLL